MKMLPKANRYLKW